MSPTILPSAMPQHILAVRKHPSTTLSDSPSDNISVSYTNKSANTVLLDYPPGAYTAMRTFDRVGIMDFSGHVARLVSSLAQIHFPESEPADTAEAPTVRRGLAPYRDPETLKTEMAELVRAALKAYYHQSADRDEAKTNEPLVVAQVEPLMVLKERRCKVKVHGSPRQHATAKDSQWVRDRSALEAGLSKDMNEALLLDDATQDLYEGLSSNLFAFDGARQTIVTAPLDSVLKGTILKVVLAVCEEQKIPIEFKFPNLKHIDEWEGAFITSTSRLVLPIKTIVLPDGSEKTFGESKVIDLIRTLVLQECKRRVEAILTDDDI
ncbi:hypothetical protein BGZ70_010444 [Mortierella alpina]|uniref:Uncharacterized protein n=1 Tax=Mortierella alpina TaxID=64518 RepID=A0A9P6IZT2_MORAP|nr:hypothetical protein BGZ70_010444 [Mortierella alpina]